MKKLLPLLLSLVLLCACADTGREQYIRFSQTVAEAESISFTANVQAEYSDKTSQFTLSYSKTADGESIEVIKPDDLAGIKANTDGASLSLEYDGAMLDVGTLADAQLSPMSALPLIVRAICTGQPDISWVEGDLTATCIIPDDDITVTLWIDEDLVPKTAEICCNERTVIFAEISDWVIS